MKRFGKVHVFEREKWRGFVGRVEPLNTPSKEGFEAVQIPMLLVLRSSQWEDFSSLK